MRKSHPRARHRRDCQESTDGPGPLVRAGRALRRRRDRRRDRQDLHRTPLSIDHLVTDGGPRPTTYQWRRPGPGVPIFEARVDDRRLTVVLERERREHTPEDGDDGLELLCL